jgi:hypothetical protein
MPGVASQHLNPATVILKQLLVSQVLAATSVLLLCGCHTLPSRAHRPVTKVVVVRPIDDFNGQSVDAVPEFLGAARYFSLSDGNKHFRAPWNWNTEFRDDGTMRVTWTTRQNEKEGLYLVEAGFFPIEVPLDHAMVIDAWNGTSAEPRPITLRMKGNTAYLPKSDRTSYRTVDMETNPHDRMPAGRRVRRIR